MVYYAPSTAENCGPETCPLAGFDVPEDYLTRAVQAGAVVQMVKNRLHSADAIPLPCLEEAGDYELDFIALQGCAHNICAGSCGRFMARTVANEVTTVRERLSVVPTPSDDV